MTRCLSILLISGTIGFTALACAPQPSEVDNLRAFAKLYGYVRFFHPSDAASEIDWERFAVYGVRQVRGASTTNELRAALDSLFLPIAPTLQIYEFSGGPPEPPDSLVPPDAADLELVAWQHLGVDLDVDLGTEAHWSVRLNRTMTTPPRPTGGSFWQKLDAQFFRGQDIELRGAVRTDGEALARLALYVELPNQQMGLSEFMVDRPITSASWDTYVLSGTVDETADSIGVAGSIDGVGTAWFDDFQLRVREDDMWVPVSLNEADFESDFAQWTTFGEGYAFEVSTDEPYQGGRTLAVTYESEPRLASPLFERQASSGEVVERSLGAGLAVRIPLALHSRNGRTIRTANAPSPSTIREDLANVVLSELDWSDESLRLADVVVAWNVLQHFFPYFDVLNVDWDAALSTTLEKAMADADAHAFLATVREMIALLQDGHAYVSHPVTQTYASLPVVPVATSERLIAASTPSISPFERGDIIEAVDGIPAIEYLEDQARLHSGSPHLAQLATLRQFGWGLRGDTTSVNIVRDGEGIVLNVVRSYVGQIPDNHPAPLGELEPGIFYVDPSRLQREEFAARIDDLSTAGGVIFDFRSRPQSNLLGYITDRPLRSPTWDVPQVIYPDREGMTFDTTRSWTVTPMQPRITGTVVFLADAGSISATESQLQIADHYELGVLIGRPTAGANGDYNRIPLPSGGFVQFAGRRVKNIDGSRLHGVGIQPDVYVARTLEAVATGRDEDIEAAINLIRSKSGR